MPAITISNPVSAAGNIELVQGDDYQAADGKALEWTFNVTDYPLLAANIPAAAVVLRIGDASDYSGSIVVTTDTITARVELSTAQTILMWIVSNVRYSLRATLAGTGGNVITLDSGRCRVRRPGGIETTS